MTGNRTVRRGGVSGSAMAALVALHGAEADGGGDIELCRVDFARFGFSGLDALGELLAMGTGVPIVVSPFEAPGAAESPAVRRIVRGAGDAHEFRATVRRLRRIGGPMYLKLEI